MPKAPLFHPSQRVDLPDFTRSAVDYTRETANLYQQKLGLDPFAHTARGFRVELPAQATYPGRVTIHGGVGYSPDGQLIFTEDQPAVNRTITLEGASTNFYVEVEFVESDSDVDSRAFWDPSVDQGGDPSGDPRPDGQEVTNNVATRRTPDWRIVQPVSTTGFARDTDLTSNKIPIIHLVTDGSNQITGPAGLTTEKAATTALRFIDTTHTHVQEAQFLPGNAGTITIGEGTANVEDVVVSAINRTTGLVTHSATANAHVTGDIVRAKGAGEPNFVVQSRDGLYRNRELEIASAGSVIDWKGPLWRGDEVHGGILSRGHSSLTDRDDANTKSLKDYVDFLAAQIQEMKWGVLSPYTSMTDATRAPPSTFSAAPRYFDRAGGLIGARMATVTVGDGSTSFGDFNGTTQAVLTAAIAALPSTGGRIHLKKGNFTLASDINVTKDVLFSGDDLNTQVTLAGGQINLNTALTKVEFRNLTFVGDSSYTGIRISNTLTFFRMVGVSFVDATLDVSTAMPDKSHVEQCYFYSATSVIDARGLVRSVTSGGNICGVWINCHFDHANGATNGSCISAGRGAIASGLVNFRALSCRFNSAGTTTDSIYAGVETNNAVIDSCSFNTSSTGMTYHIQAGDGSDSVDNITIRDCKIEDVVAGVLNCNGGVVVRVQNVAQGYTAFSGDINLLKFVDCINVAVEDCNFVGHSVSALTTSIIEIWAHALSPGLSGGYKIKHNTFSQNTVYGDNLVGITFDTDGGTGTDRGVQDVLLEDNTFAGLEVGVLFKNTVTGTYQDIRVIGNTFGGSFMGALSPNMKIGILMESGEDAYRNFSIIGNTFRGLDPANNDEVIGGTGRAGIYSQAVLSASVISNNNMINIGQSGSTVYAAGVRLGASLDNQISNNSIQALNGSVVFGVHIGDVAVAVSRNTIVNQNVISGLTGTNVCGVYWNDDQTALTISDNTFRSLSGTSCICIGDGTGVTVIGLVVNSNSAQLDDTDSVGVLLVGTNYYCISIVGNAFYGSTGNGINYAINCAASGTMDTLHISGNTILNHLTGGISVANATSVLVGITGNTIKSFNATTVGNGIDVDNATYITVVGNNVFSYATGSCNIRMYSGTERVVIANNIVRLAAGSTFSNIFLDTTTEHYVISGNICEGTVGGGGTHSIDTNGAGGDGGLIMVNLIDQNTALRAADNTAGAPYNQTFNP
jgi:hypothetical protein